MLVIIITSCMTSMCDDFYMISYKISMEHLFYTDNTDQ